MINKIKPLQSLYYFKFYGLLIQYVEFIKEGFPLSQKLVNYSKSLDLIDVPIPKQEFKPVGKISLDELEKFNKKRK